MRFDVAWRRRVARRLRPILIQPDARALDLCCGTGDLTLALAGEAASGARMLGADFAHPMLTRAVTKAAVLRQPLVQFIEADALSLPFPDRSFDVVTTAFGFRNLANYRAGLTEICRILRPGGTVAILEFSEPRQFLVGRAFRFYFRHILPRLGGMISGNPGAYRYLPASVGTFPPPAELARWMAEAGLTSVRYESWTGGIVTLHTGQRRR
jgi:demethylmenaquinone methyltransferase/2-methoxy-6-polyprenyl-1,4-benzoquinol methylase